MNDTQQTLIKLDLSPEEIVRLNNISTLTSEENKYDILRKALKLYETLTQNFLERRTTVIYPKPSDFDLDNPQIDEYILPIDKGTKSRS